MSTLIAVNSDIGIAEAAYDAIIICDREGRIQSWNRGAETLYGWLKNEAIGAQSQHLLRTSFPCPVEEIQQQLSAVGQWEGELSQVSRSLDAIVVSSRWVVQSERVARGQVIQVNKDITKQRKSEDDLRSMNDKLERMIEEHRLTEAEFRGIRECMEVELQQSEETHRMLLRRFRHDLTDHLGSIMGFLKLLQNGRLGQFDERQQRCFETMDLSAANLLKVIEQIAQQTSIPVVRRTNAPFSSPSNPKRVLQEQ